MPQISSSNLKKNGWFTMKLWKQANKFWNFQNYSTIKFAYFPHQFSYWEHQLFKSETCSYELIKLINFLDTFWHILWKNSQYCSVNMDKEGGRCIHILESLEWKVTCQDIYFPVLIVTSNNNLHISREKHYLNHKNAE